MSVGYTARDPRRASTPPVLVNPSTNRTGLAARIPRRSDSCTRRFVGVGRAGRRCPFHVKPGAQRRQMRWARPPAGPPPSPRGASHLSLLARLPRYGRSSRGWLVPGRVASGSAARAVTQYGRATVRSCHGRSAAFHVKQQPSYRAASADGMTLHGAGGNTSRAAMRDAAVPRDYGNHGHSQYGTWTARRSKAAPQERRCRPLQVQHRARQPRFHVKRTAPYALDPAVERMDRVAQGLGVAPTCCSGLVSRRRVMLGPRRATLTVSRPELGECRRSTWALMRIARGVPEQGRNPTRCSCILRSFTWNMCDDRSAAPHRRSHPDACGTGRSWAARRGGRRRAGSSERFGQ